MARYYRCLKVWIQHAHRVFAFPGTNCFGGRFSSTLVIFLPFNAPILGPILFQQTSIVIVVLQPLFYSMFCLFIDISILLNNLNSFGVFHHTAIKRTLGQLSTRRPHLVGQRHALLRDQSGQPELRVVPGKLGMTRTKKIAGGLEVSWLGLWMVMFLWILVKRKRFLLGKWCWFLVFVGHSSVIVWETGKWTISLMSVP